MDTSSEEKVMLTQEEKQKFFEELRCENERILDQYKMKMEIEFQTHLKGLLGGMTSAEVTNDLGAVDYDEVNQTNKKFFTAAQDRSSSPKINIYEGGAKKTVVRASAEVQGTMKPAVVTSRGDLLHSTQHTTPPPPISHKLSQLKMYADPISSAKSMRSPVASKKRLTKEQFQADQADKNSTLRSVQVFGDELDPMESRMNGTTRGALAKSRELLREMQGLKGLRKGKKKRVESGGQHALPMVSKQQAAADRGYRSIEVSGRPKSGDSQPVQGKSVVFPHVDGSVSVDCIRPVSGSAARPLSGGQRSGDPGDGNDKGDLYDDDEYYEDEDVDTAELTRSPSKYVTTVVPLDGDDGGGAEMEGYLNKYSWENHLARHILSVFATSHCTTNESRSKAVLEMVDGAQGLHPDELKEEGLFKDLRQEQRRVEEIAKRPSTKKGDRPGSAVDKVAPQGGTGTVTAPHRKQSKTNSAGTKRKNSAAKDFREPLHDPVKGIAYDGITKMIPSERPIREEVAIPATKTMPATSVRGPPKVFPIWFYSSGSVYAEWLSLPNGHRLQNTVDGMLERKQYQAYMDLVCAVLDQCCVETFYKMTNDTATSEGGSTALSSGMISKKSGGSSRRRQLDEVSLNGEEVLTLEELRPLCRQAVLTANAFATLAIENKLSDRSMGLIRVAETWAAREDILDAATRAELKAYIDVTLAFYFFRRKMTSASLSHSTKAHDYFLKTGRDDYVAMCLIMLSCCKYQVSNFKAAHKVLYQVLGMVDNGKLAFEEARPKELCMVAVAYHNLAVVQLRLQVPDAAAKSSQNARKIARLCLSHSNRWINIFHWTHQVAVEDVKQQLQNNYNLTEEQFKSMTQLTDIMYDPNPS